MPFSGRDKFEKKMQSFIEKLVSFVLDIQNGNRIVQTELYRITNHKHFDELTDEQRRKVIEIYNHETEAILSLIGEALFVITEYEKYTKKSEPMMKMSPAVSSGLLSLLGYLTRLKENIENDYITLATQELKDILDRVESEIAIIREYVEKTESFKGIGTDDSHLDVVIRDPLAQSAYDFLVEASEFLKNHDLFGYAKKQEAIYKENYYKLKTKNKSLYRFLIEKFKKTKRNKGEDWDDPSNHQLTRKYRKKLENIYDNTVEKTDELIEKGNDVIEKNNVYKLKLLPETLQNVKGTLARLNLLKDLFKQKGK